MFLEIKTRGSNKWGLSKMEEKRAWKISIKRN